MQLDNLLTGANYWFTIQSIKRKFRDVSQFELTIISLIGSKALKCSSIELLTGRSNLRAKLERLSIHGRINIIKHSNRAIWYRLSDKGRDIYLNIIEEHENRMQAINEHSVDEVLKEL